MAPYGESPRKQPEASDRVGGYVVSLLGLKGLDEMNLNTLPTRDEYQRAIQHLWSGGGTASLIVDVARQAGASITEVQELAERLSASLANGLHFVSRDIAEQELETVRTLGARRENKKLQGQSGIDWDRCVFVDGVDCPQCTALERTPVRHGRLLSSEEGPR